MNDQKKSLKQHLNFETAEIRWTELQTFFAHGSVIFIGPELDLIHVAEQLAADNTKLFQEWLSAGRVGSVTDQQAMDWHERDAVLWSVVIKPWVLVQES